MSSAAHFALPLEAVCPLCGQANQCAMARKSEEPNCWCMHTRIDRTVLASLPASEQGGRRCICPACASQQPGAGSSDSTVRDL